MTSESLFESLALPTDLSDNYQQSAASLRRLIIPLDRFMRRNWLGVLLFALALAVQALAPGAANVAMARAAAQAQGSVELCLQAGGDFAGGDQRLPGHQDRHHDACPLCQVCCDGVAPFAARPNQVGMAPVQWTALAWTVADRVLPAPRHEHSHQARAPPAIS